MTFLLAGTAIGVASACGFAWGLRFQRRPSGARRAGLAVAALLIGLKACLGVRPELEIRLFPWPAYGFVSSWWALAPFSVILGWACRSLPQSRRAIYFGFAGFFYLAFLGDQALRFTTDYEALTGKPDAFGLCEQTSPYTCGPAAAASFLYLLGYETSEAEMAKLTRPTRLTGVNEHLLTWGINRFLRERGAPLRVRVAPLPKILTGLGGEPVLVMRRLNLLVSHWMVLSRTRSEEIEVLDPLEGRARQPRVELQKTLMPLCVRVEKRLSTRRESCRSAEGNRA